VKKSAQIFLALLFTLISLNVPPTRAQSSSDTARQQSSATTAAPPTDNATPPPRITHYTLPPDRDQKARAISTVRLRLVVIDLIYGLAVLFFILRAKLAAKYRDVAEKSSQNRFFQALIF